MDIEYEFSINSDFPNGVDIGKLHNEIKYNINLSDNFKGIITSEEIITIIFDSDINLIQEQSLAEIIDNHNPSKSYNVKKSFCTLLTNNGQIKTLIITNTINNTGYIVDTNITVNRIDGIMEIAYFEKKGLFKNTFNNLIKIQQEELILQENPNWNINLDTSGSNIILEIQGENSKTLEWNINYKLITVN